MAGILDDDDEQKTNLNIISKQSNISETTISKRKLKVEVVTDTKMQDMESDQGSEDKPVQIEHEISQQDHRDNNERSRSFQV